MDTLIGRERAVIGSLLIDSSDGVTSFVMGYLVPSDFSIPELRAIYTTMTASYGKQQPIDIATMMDAGHDVSLLAELAGEGFVQSCRAHAVAVKTASMLRAVRSKAETLIVEIGRMGFDNPADVLEYANGVMTNDLPKLQTAPEKFDEIVNEVADSLEADRKNERKPMKFGMRDLDSNTGGLRGAEMTIVAAGPGTGKTAFAMCAAVNVAKQGLKVLLVSREMNRIQCAKRVIANLGTVEAEQLRDGRSMTDEAWQGFGQTVGKAARLDIRINDRIATIQELSNRSRRLREKNELDLLILDYLQLLQSSSKHESRRHEVEYVSRQLKLLSLDLGIPIIALSQLSREGRKNGRPKLHDLRESGAIEQDADNVIFLYDPNEEENRQAAIIPLEIIIAKQRNGRTGMVRMAFHKTYQRFVGVER